MKFLNMKKVQEGNYIARYDIVYETYVRQLESEPFADLILSHPVMARK